MYGAQVPRDAVIGSDAMPFHIYALRYVSEPKGIRIMARLGKSRARIYMPFWGAKPPHSAASSQRHRVRSQPHGGRRRPAPCPHSLPFRQALPSLSLTLSANWASSLQHHYPLHHLPPFQAQSWPLHRQFLHPWKEEENKHLLSVNIY